MVAAALSVNNPRVTVVLPVYNGAAYVRDAVDSVLRQTFHDFELVIVDDGSTDATPDVLKPFAADPRVRVIRQMNRGVSAARNTGIAGSTAAYIALIDADDVWAEANLARKIECLEHEPAAALAHGAVVLVDAQLRPLGSITGGQSGHVLAALLLGVEPVVNGPSSAVLRRTCLDAIGGFDERLSTSADWDLWVRIAARYPIAYVPEPLVSYRLRGGENMHRNIRVMERDKRLAYAKAFASPLPPEIARLRRRCYANLYMTLAGSYFHAGEWSRTAAHLLRCALTHPGRLSHALGWPRRAFLRTMQGLHP